MSKSSLSTINQTQLNTLPYLNTIAKLKFQCFEKLSKVCLKILLRFNTQICKSVSSICSRHVFNLCIKESKSENSSISKKFNITKMFLHLAEVEKLSHKSKMGQSPKETDLEFK